VTDLKSPDKSPKRVAGQQPGNRAACTVRALSFMAFSVANKRRV
jgi:hypothetical protein